MLCGIDEAGRGPVIGPLVVAGVIFKNDSKLIEYNVRDSKKITPKRRNILAKKIMEIAEDYEIIIISASDIDDMRKIMTLNEIEVNIFGKIINKLKPDVCFIDAVDVNDKRFSRNIMSRLSYEPEIISKHKADDIYPIVGAASILAKTIRDREIKSISENLEKKLNLPLGSGYPSDPNTKKFLKNWLKKFGNLPPNVRHSWRTSQNLIKEKKTKSLDNFN
jgi:ribonuclease HII